ATINRCAVERALYLDQACEGEKTIPVVFEGMQNGFRSRVRFEREYRAASDSPAVKPASVLGRAEQGSLHVDQTGDRSRAIGAIALPAEGIQNRLRACARVQ